MGGWRNGFYQSGIRFVILLGLVLPAQSKAFSKADPIKTPPPSVSKNCWMSDDIAPSPSQPVEPFLYQPFDMAWSGEIWSANMDHTYPNYQGRNTGSVAALGEWLDDKSKGNFQQYAKKYNYYFSPSLEIWFGYDGHDGNDFTTNGETGHSAFASADGTIVRFEKEDTGAIGRYVDIYHPQGYLTRYAHLAKIFPDFQEVGKTVRTGEAFGEIGTSGKNTTGIHLHFGVYRWNENRGEWEITDPFGWDPWLDAKGQINDPLYSCNGEISFDLWVGGWPRAMDGREGEAARPMVRNIGGWLGEDVTQPAEEAPVESSPFQGTIFDDLGKRFRGAGGEWVEATSGYKDHHWWSKNTTENPGEIKMLINPTSQGNWEVFTFIPETGTTTRAEYRIYHNGEIAEVYVNQRENQNSWVSLGSFDFSAEGEEYLVISNRTSEEPASTIVSFDAIGILWRENDGLEMPLCFHQFGLMLLVIFFALKQINCYSKGS